MIEQIKLNFDHPRDSQCGRILSELLRGRKLRKWDIIHELGVLNAGGRCWDLKHGKYDGTKYPVKMQMVEVETRSGKTKVAEYFLEMK